MGFLPNFSGLAAWRLGVLARDPLRLTPHSHPPTPALAVAGCARRFVHEDAPSTGIRRGMSRARRPVAVLSKSLAKADGALELGGGAAIGLAKGGREVAVAREAQVHAEGGQVVVLAEQVEGASQA